MKQKLFISLSAFAVLLMATGTYAVTVTGNANAKIRKQITATETTQMNFGTIAPDTSAGSVVLGTNSTLTTVPSTYQTYGTVKSGIFSVTGQPSTSLSASVASSSVSNGGNSMTLTNFTTSPATITTDTSGNATINTGATLNVAANQPSGDYTGTYSLVINY